MNSNQWPVASSSTPSCPCSTTQIVTGQPLFEAEDSARFSRSAAAHRARTMEAAESRKDSPPLTSFNPAAATFQPSFQLRAESPTFVASAAMSAPQTHSGILSDGSFYNHPSSAAAADGVAGVDEAAQIAEAIGLSYFR